MGFRAGHVRFAMPASLGLVKASTLSLTLGPWLRKLLAPEVKVEMHVAESYAALIEDLRAGRVDAAWAPPLVLAQVEREGGRRLVQFERGGSTTFRSAFVCRADHPVRLDALEHVSVAWVARESASGYLLPRKHLEKLGVELSNALGDELFAGSFAAALEALIAGKVQLTAVYAAPENAAVARSGLDTLPPTLRAELRVIGYSEEMQNDGIVASSSMPEAMFQLMRARLTTSHEDPSARDGLKAIFDADRLV
jgi:phosphonate transport system substrate-binding protein